MREVIRLSAAYITYIITVVIRGFAHVGPWQVPWRAWVLVHSIAAGWLAIGVYVANKTKPVKIALTIIGLLTVALIFMPLPKANADIITCPYPGVGHKVDIQVIATIQGFYCDDPIEINGSHMHCQSGSGGIGLNAGATGPGLGAITNTFGFGQLQVGGAQWDCGWVCPPRPGDPDILWATIGPPAAQPNPPGAWKDRIKPAKCSVYERGGPYDDNSLPPAGLNPFYELSPGPPSTVPESSNCPASENNSPSCINPSPIVPGR